MRAVATLVLFTVVLGLSVSCGGGKKASPVPDRSPAPTETVTSTAAPFASCTADDLNLTPTTWASADAVMVDVVVQISRRCLLDDVLQVGVEVRVGNETRVVSGNALAIHLAADRGGEYPIGRATWRSWCEPGGWQFSAFASLGPKKVNEPVETPPACRPGVPSDLTLAEPPPPEPTPVAACDTTKLRLSVAIQQTVGALQFNVIAGYEGPRCLLRDGLAVTVLDSSGKPAAVHTNGLVAWIDTALPQSRPLARFLWGNWCGSPGGFSLRAELATSSATLPLNTVPSCEAPGGISKLELLRAAPGAFPTPVPTPTPLPGGLRRPESMPPNPTVWIYAGDRPASTNCIDIVAGMVPSRSAKRVPAERFTCGGNLSRLRFVEDEGGTFYLEHVQLLLLAGVTLPQGYAYSECGDIREHLIAASEPVESAAYVLVCGVQPLPRGSVSDNPLLIWGRIVEGLAPTVVPAGRPCWEFSRYLGSAGEAKTINIQCVLE